MRDNGTGHQCGELLKRRQAYTCSVYVYVEHDIMCAVVEEAKDFMILGSRSYKIALIGVP